MAKLQYLETEPGDESIAKALSLLDHENRGCILKLRPGVYEEDIEFPANVCIEGMGVADLDFTVIRGSHYLPEFGRIAFKHVKFEGSYTNFQEVENADLNLLFRSCVFTVKEGKSFAIPSSRGLGIFFDCLSQGKENGFIDNGLGGMRLNLYNMSSLSENPASTMLVSGYTLLFNVHFNHVIWPSCSEAKVIVQGGSWLEVPVLR